MTFSCNNEAGYATLYATECTPFLLTFADSSTREKELSAAYHVEHSPSGR
jgi:hypothetical protein